MPTKPIKPIRVDSTLSNCFFHCFGCDNQFSGYVINRNLTFVACLQCKSVDIAIISNEQPTKKPNSIFCD